MKKILILTVALFSLMSCSDNDNSIDPVIGSWFPFSENGVESSDCEKKSTLTFSENGAFTTTNYILDGNECFLDNEASGIWSAKAGSVYTITISGRAEGDDGVLVFSNNNDTFTITSEGEEAGTTEVSVFNRK